MTVVKPHNRRGFTLRSHHCGIVAFGFYYSQGRRNHPKNCGGISFE